MDLIMKRKELLGLSEQPQLPSETTADTETTESVNILQKNIFSSFKILCNIHSKAKVEDAILSCKIVQVVFMNAVKQAQGFFHFLYV